MMQPLAWLVGFPWLLLADQASQPSGSRCLLQQQTSTRTMFQQGPLASPPEMQLTQSPEMLANANGGVLQQPLQGSFASQPQARWSSGVVAEQPHYEIAMPAQPAVAAQPVMQGSMPRMSPIQFAMPPQPEYFQAQGMIQGQPQLQFQHQLSQMPVLQTYPLEQQQFQQQFSQMPVMEPYQPQQFPLPQPQLTLQQPLVQMPVFEAAYQVQQVQQPPAQALPWLLPVRENMPREMQNPSMAMLQERSQIVGGQQQPVRLWDRLFGWLR